jgi:hypothetical protein
VGPEVVFVQAQQVSKSPPVAGLGKPAAQPALDRLGVNPECLGDVDIAEPGAGQGAAERFTDRATVRSS